jgi:DNA-binding beta-propeller fold protein YncE
MKSINYMKFLFFLFFHQIFITPQDYKYSFSIGDFVNASSFHINQAGFIYVADAGNNEVLKLDTLGNIIKEIGGYGWDESAFDNPADLYSAPLNLYVCDKNNHRIQSFDKDLNFISQLSTRDSKIEEQNFGYPLSCVISNQGDLFILDSENKRIIKFDLFGNFISNFGGYDYGNFTLSSPKKLSISSTGDLYVIDQNRIVVFDQYGTGLTIIYTDYEFGNLNIIYNILTVNTFSQVFISDLRDSILELKELNLAGINPDSEIVSSFIFNNRLYLLTKNEILVFDRDTEI